MPVAEISRFADLACLAPFCGMHHRQHVQMYYAADAVAAIPALAVTLQASGVDGSETCLQRICMQQQFDTTAW